MRARTGMQAMAVGLAAIVIAGCGVSLFTEPDAVPVAGDWLATKMEFTEIARPETVIDYVAVGAAITLTVTADHKYTMTVRAEGRPDEVMTGTWTVLDNVMRLTLTGIPLSQQFQMTLTPDTLRLANGQVPYDLNADGVLELSWLTMEFIRM